MPESQLPAQGVRHDSISCDVNQRKEIRRDDSRRGFIRGSSLLLAGALPAAGVAGAAATASRGDLHHGTGGLKIGLVGCGYRGIGAVSELLAATAATVPVQVTALADAFPDRLQQALRTLRGRFGDRVTADGASRFMGLRAFEELLATDVDVVLLATPPVFRPVQFEAAIAAGKHVYAETPIATDIPGVDRFQAALAGAQSQNLAVAVGLPQRYQSRYRLTIEHLRQGAVGQILTVHVAHPSVFRKIVAGPPSLTDFQSQLRRWPEYPWASGGSLVEQRVRGLDVVNWLLGSHPVEARSLACTSGSAQAASGGPGGQEEELVELSYPGGVKVGSATACSSRASGKNPAIFVYGSAGWCDLAAGKIYNPRNELVWRADDALAQGESLSWAAEPAVIHDLASSPRKCLAVTADCGLWSEFLSTIVQGPGAMPGVQPGAVAVDSTRTAILGRMASFEQRPVSWEECLRNREVFAGISSSPATLALTAID